jgi:hypothetical protein
MPSRRFTLYLLILALVAIFPATRQPVVARATVLVDHGVSTEVSGALGLTKRDGHGHHHGEPLLEINETEITMYHAPTPPSYWSIDVDGADLSATRHPGLMMMHGVFMSLAFFVAFPMSAWLAI